MLILLSDLFDENYKYLKIKSAELFVIQLAVLDGALGCFIFYLD
jgi:hypothetical protein